MLFTKGPTEYVREMLLHKKIAECVALSSDLSNEAGGGGGRGGGRGALPTASGQGGESTATSTYTTQTGFIGLPSLYSIATNKRYIGWFFYWSALKMTKCQPLKEISELSQKKTKKEPS